MSFFGKASDILGINARNLLYITKYNTRGKKELADSKIHTKHFLQARDVGVARLYASINSLPELRNFNRSNLPPSFVIKPNKGYGGEGIWAIKRWHGDTYTDVNNKNISWSDLYEHCIGILDGKYAISGLSDTVIFEEMLEPHDYFKKFMEAGGLPDIRIIVFKYVPVIAMLRLPTAESHGKANLHLGAIGLGIDIGTGKTTFGVRHNKLVKRLPTGDPVGSIAIPQWDEILATASRTQYLSQIGYLAVDITLAKNGIKILELNARAGLAIQISNQTLLRKRLEKIADLKVMSTKEGVKIGKTLFTRVVKEEKVLNVKTAKPIIGLFESINIINAINGANIHVKIDPHSENNIIDQGIKLSPAGRLLSIVLKEKKLKIPFTTDNFKDKPYKAILSGKYLTDFLIDTSKIKPEPTSSAPIESKEEKILLNIDKKILAINECIHLIARIKPQNLNDEFKKFIKKPVHSPQFIYKKHDLNINHLRNEIKKIPKNIDHPLMPLYLEKIKEIDDKLSLIDNIGRPEMAEYSIKLFGSVSNELYEQALSFMKNEKLEKDTSKKLNTEEVIKRLSAYLSQKKLTRWKIKILETATSGMQINKKNTIFVNKKANFSENRLKALIAHEIETHIFRLENGRLQKYSLFEQGTANYLTTEEGLAIYNQNSLGIPLGEKYFSPALNIAAIYHGNNLSFTELFHFLQSNFKIDKAKAWRICVRTKRGLENTNEPGAFAKDIVYFIGYQMIQRLLKDKGIDELKKLYIGKIGIHDLKYIHDPKQWPIKFLPEIK
ncbi:DUF1704 domain-containing protein [Patescibacteria group bacterium]|nr:DUF1704 domain-containing protein [Patescibacteria group bacterium]